jgi:hypothetical protein
MATTAAPTPATAASGPTAAPTSAASAPVVQAPQPITQCAVQLPPATPKDVLESHYITPSTIALAAAIVASFIAAGNWRTARNKLRLDLLDARLEIFNSLSKAGDLMMYNKFTLEHHKSCIEAYAKAPHILNTKIMHYIKTEIMPLIYEHRKITFYQGDTQSTGIKLYSPDLIERRAEIAKTLTLKQKPFQDIVYPTLKIKD